MKEDVVCLDRLYEKKFPRHGVGFKVFATTDERGHAEKGMLYGDCQAQNLGRPINKWLHEKDFRRGAWYQKRRMTLRAGYCSDAGRYRKGWHIFLTADGASAWWTNGPRDAGFVIRRVRFRNAVAWGRQSLADVIVAKEMKILYGGKVTLKDV